MGTISNEQTNNVFYLNEGRVIQRTNETSGDNVFEKNGKFYKSFDGISGRIINVEKKSGYESNIDVRITLLDDDQTTKNYLEFTIGSGYWISFSKAFPNLDVNATVELYPTFKIEEGTKKTSLLMKQNGEWLKRFYSVDNKADLPEPKTVTVKGKTVYDYEDQENFLFDLICKKLKNDSLPF